jgi:hypothetical protein
LEVASRNLTKNCENNQQPISHDSMTLILDLNLYLLYFCYLSAVAELGTKTWAGQSKADTKNSFKTKHLPILNTTFGSTDHHT